MVLPAEPGNFARVRAVAGKVVYQRGPRSGAGEGPEPVMMYDLEEREEQTVVGDADSFEIAAGGEKTLVVSGGTWAIVEVAPGQEMKTPLRLDELETVLDPRAEWRQMFDDVWRTYRDIFYDPGMHGLDWDGFGSATAGPARRRGHALGRELLIRELIGELNSSHTYVGGGDAEDAALAPGRPARRRLGRSEDGAYRIARILAGAAVGRRVLARRWRRPGVDVTEGDFVLAVNGAAARRRPSIRAPPFEGLAGETVLLTSTTDPTRGRARGARRDAGQRQPAALP